MLQADDIGEILSYDNLMQVGEVKVHQQRIAPSGNVEQILLTYNGDEYSITVEKWADALPSGR